MIPKKKLRKKRCKNIGLVGYTNAGKSTLFNRLTHAGVLVEDKLFATLDSTSRSLKLGNGKEAVISDTVGFISDLPHHLVASFRATLKEAEEADFLIHVTDISDENFQKHMADVDTVLKAIGADHIPHILVFNKIDRVSEATVKGTRNSYPDAQFISAATGPERGSFFAKSGGKPAPHSKSHPVDSTHGTETDTRHSQSGKGP